MTAMIGTCAPRALALAAAVFALACCSSKPPAAAPRGDDATTTDATAPATDGSTETTMHKSSGPAPAFEPAQAIASRAALETWLASQSSETLLRVPVELQVSVLGVGGAAVGFGADRLAVKLDEGALGESLADRAAMWCGEGPTCAMWLWGHWQDGTLRVVKAEGAIAAGDRRGATHVFVAK